MKLQAFRGFTLSLIVLTTISAFSGTNELAKSDAEYSLKLYYKKEVVISSEAIQSLYSNSVQLVETSNFNSRNTPASSWPFDVTRTQDDYRKAVSGRYLLVAFKETQKIKTQGGELGVKEIIIGLNRPDIASSLHTVDNEGRVVGHAKYAGPLCSIIMDAVKKAASKAN